MPPVPDSGLSPTPVREAGEAAGPGLVRPPAEAMGEAMAASVAASESRADLPLASGWCCRRQRDAG
ncbi:MAG: hypothetical protein ACK535_13400, partial [Cyanobacteriota bacterium]